MQKKNSSASSSSRFDKNKKPSSGTSWKREDSARPKKTTNKPQSSSSSSQTQPYKKQGLRGGTAAAQARAAARKFNPSDFIQKVEEQVVAAPYISKHSFSDFPIAEQLKINIAQKGYTQPTPIQDQAIPILLQERDIVATANTGTGKTAAFLIPLINNLLTKKTSKILIITPTRELAEQIQTELISFKNKTGFFTALCIGGVKIDRQIGQLQKNPAFVIGTPGRLKDLENQRQLNFGSFTSLVLDEVDTMFDMGFVRDITYIISKLPAKRHLIFFSATISPEIKKVMDTCLKNPSFVSVKTRQSAANVNQDVIKIGGRNKTELLHDILIKPECTRSIVFLRTKHAVDALSRQLKERGFEVASIHGNKSQEQRSRALSLFKNGKVNVLLATDVVARGIDVDDVSHVINYDLPQSHEDYIHRIGRTGRASKIGQALTFID